MVLIELTEEQQKILFEIINSAQFHGKDVEFVVELKQAIMRSSS